MDERYQQILGLGELKPTTKYVCFLPWCGEFGWYLMNHVKRIHGYNHDNKIVCIKRGHEALFPRAEHLFYDWSDDRPDELKAGANKHNNQDNTIKSITAKFGNDVTFIYPDETSWTEKKSLAHIKFIPKITTQFGLKTDIVIAPRWRMLDRVRNYNNWQKIVDIFNANKWSVGVCGTKETSYQLKNVKFKSWDYGDVDSDIELIRNSKIVVTQESGMAYLAMMCEKPLFIIDRCHKEIANLHRNKNVYFKNYLAVWGDPQKIAMPMKRFMKWHRLKNRR